ncbi:O-antigen ligase family protein [Muriicola sp. E247]|uniref:O-antigen ligase family protein n=1 Tax=Muriicola sp. E247 TaxID=3242730 RepID=UPI003526A4B6
MNFLSLEITNRKILNVALATFGIFPLLPYQIKGLPVAFILFVGVYALIKGSGKHKIDSGFYVLISLFTISLLSIVYTGSFNIPWGKIETSISLYLIPLAFLLIKRIDKLAKFERRTFCVTFIASTFILSLISIFYYLKQGLFSDSELKVNSFRQAITELPLIGDHPIYISIYLGIAFLLGIEFFKHFNNTGKLFLGMSSTLIVFHLLLLSSKGIVLAVLITTIFYIFKAIEKRSLRLSLTAVIVILFLTALYLFPNLERRFREIGRKTTYTELRLQNSSSIRLAVYKCGIQMAMENPILGYGWGEGNKALKECYKSKSEELFTREPNAHNQYLGYLLDGGLPALFTLVFFIFYFLRSAFIRNDLIMFSLIFFYTIILATENILVRQSGLILFIFIFAFFYYSTEQKSNHNYHLKH